MTLVPAPPKYIVAEVSRNWNLEDPDLSPTLGERFEEVLSVNLRRGYVLQEFRMTAVMTSSTMLTETIIAVFMRP
jgi:hypothetical protein